MQLPPIIPYAFGAVLVLFGALRLKYLAAPRGLRADEDAAPDADAGDGTPADAPDAAAETRARKPRRMSDQRRHKVMGVAWILMGLFLIVSTYLQAHRR